MPTILAIETATNACSVALLHAGELSTRSQCVPRTHSDCVLPMIEAVRLERGIRLEQLDAIVFGQGPGSFLGTRIAVGVAQGLGFALNRPLIGVSTLAALAIDAQQRHQATRVVAGWDARLQGIYWGCYEWDGEVMTPVVEDQLSDPESLPLSVLTESTILVGNAWSVYADHCSPEWLSSSRVIVTDTYPQASGLIPLALIAYNQGEGVAAQNAKPIYLRSPVVSA